MNTCFSAAPVRTRFSVQAPSAVVMVCPRRFRLNPQTAADNAFQSPVLGASAEALAQSARREAAAAADILRAHGVRVHMFEEDGTSDTPDAVFPNNWFSTHAGGHVAIYPMFSPNRRLERRSDVIELLKAEYRVQDVIDYSGLEADGVFLEGTGAMVLDHLARVAYAAVSNRAHAAALERFCAQFNFEPMVFDTADAKGRAVYHTNVMMCVATDFALVGLHLISDPARRRAVRSRLEDTGRTVIPLEPSQIKRFAGNALELSGNQERFLALSTQAIAILRPDQKACIERSAQLLPLAVPTIELAGGSVRCMLAGIHLARR